MITVETTGWIEGRNGMFDLSAVGLSAARGTVLVDGIGKRGKVIRGGLGLEARALDKLALIWLDGRRVEGAFEPELAAQVDQFAQAWLESRDYQVVDRM